MKKIMKKMRMTHWMLITGFSLLLGSVLLEPITHTYAPVLVGLFLVLAVPMIVVLGQESRD